MKKEDLPKEYIDCVIEHIDGCKRIGRLHHGGLYFELASYQNRKDYVVWPVEKVVSCKEIKY